MTTRNRPEHPAPVGVKMDYWPCSLLLTAPSLLLDRPPGPLSATLRIACRDPYTIEVAGETCVTRASLVAPKAERKRIIAPNSGIALLFYLPLQAPRHAALRALISDRKLVDLPITLFEPLLPRIRAAMQDVRPAPEIKSLVRDVIEAISGQSLPEADGMDPRIAKACAVLDELPQREAQIRTVASRVHLWPSRLRKLFREEVGFTIGECARWRAVLHGKRGLTLTDVALEAGFHDLSHADKAINDGLRHQSVDTHRSAVRDPHQLRARRQGAGPIRRQPGGKPLPDTPRKDGSIHATQVH